MFCAGELFYVGKAHPCYSQVTLERSDFRTDFRTRLKSKAISMNPFPKRILRHQTNIAYMTS